MAAPEALRTPKPETDDLALLRKSDLNGPIEEMVNLLSQTRRAFLLGAGCSKCAGLPLMLELTKSALEGMPKEDPARAILAEIAKNFDGATGCTIEDYMSELVDLISISERRESKKSKSAHIKLGKQLHSVDALESALITIKKHIADAINIDRTELQHHRNFVQAVHFRLHSGRGASQSASVDYFTTNYDTLLEDALSLERIAHVDGFSGGATAWWDTRSFSSSVAHARVFKIHGSIDWCVLDDDAQPLRVRKGLDDQKLRDPVLIWPASTKYREAQRDPFAQLFSHFRSSLRPRPNNELVLLVSGYAFGDPHINLEIERGLVESEGRLTLIILTDADSPVGIVKSWHEDERITEQVRVYARRGFFHASRSIPSEQDLPWWKFEVLTRLLGGDR